MTCIDHSQLKYLFPFDWGFYNLRNYYIEHPCSDYSLVDSYEDHFAGYLINKESIFVFIAVFDDQDSCLISHRSHTLSSSLAGANSQKQVKILTSTIFQLNSNLQQF